MNLKFILCIYCNTTKNSHVLVGVFLFSSFIFLKRLFFSCDALTVKILTKSNSTQTKPMQSTDNSSTVKNAGNRIFFSRKGIQGKKKSRSAIFLLSASFLSVIKYFIVLTFYTHMFFHFPFFFFENSLIWLRLQHHWVSLFDIPASFLIKKQTENIVKPLSLDEKGLELSTNVESFLHLSFSVSSTQTKHSQLWKTKTFPG